MTAQPSRLSLALDFACAAMLVLVSGHVADAMMARSILPLEEEFADVCLSGRRFYKRLAPVIITDRECLRSCHTRDRRLVLLRKASVMPSVAILALIDAIGCDPSERLDIDYRKHRLVFPVVARELGVSEAFLRMCWQTEADLDSQWRSYRDELLKIRAEWAVAP